MAERPPATTPSPVLGTKPTVVIPKPTVAPVAVQPPSVARGNPELPPTSRIAMEAIPREVNEVEPSALETYTDMAVRDYPLVTLAAAAGVGAVIGWLIKR